VQLPPQAGASVTLSVTVKRPDGGVSSGSYTFTTITTTAAGLEEVLCQISHILTQGPFQTKPGDPGPEAGVVLNPGDIASLASIAAQLTTATGAAAKLGGAVTLTPAAAASRAALTVQPVAIAQPAIAAVAKAV
jgi:hypothetical protein